MAICAVVTLRPDFNYVGFSLKTDQKIQSLWNAATRVPIGTGTVAMPHTHPIISMSSYTFLGTAQVLVMTYTFLNT